jgi:hypothetical protein
MPDDTFPRAVDPATFPGAFAYACPDCGQATLTRFPCDPCARRAREPQGVASRLFEPAPEQLAGQLTFT